MWQPVAKTLRTGVSGQAEELMRGYHNLSRKYITKVSGSTVTTSKKIDAKIVNDLRTATHEDSETVRLKLTLLYPVQKLTVILMSLHAHSFS